MKIRGSDKEEPFDVKSDIKSQKAPLLKFRI